MRAYLTLFMLAGVSALRPYAGIAAPRLPLAASVRMSDAPATAGGIDWAETAKYPLATAAQAPVQVDLRLASRLHEAARTSGTGV